MATGMTLKQAENLMLKMSAFRDYRVPLKAIKIKLVSSVKENFQKESSPAGEAWVGLSENTVREHDKARRKTVSKLGQKGQAAATIQKYSVRLLRDRGILYNSISTGPGHVEEITDQTLMVGTNLPYAAVHQFGSTENNIPARPYMGFKDSDILFAQDTIADYEVDMFMKG